MKDCFHLLSLQISVTETWQKQSEQLAAHQKALNSLGTGIWARMDTYDSFARNIVCCLDVSPNTVSSYKTGTRVNSIAMRA